MKVNHPKNTSKWTSSHGIMLCLITGLSISPRLGSAKGLDSDPEMLNQVAWVSSNEEDSLQTWIPLQEPTEPPHVAIDAIEFNPEKGSVFLQLTNRSTKIQRVHVWYADQNKEEDDFSALKWQFLSENLEIQSGQDFLLIDSGKQSGGLPLHFFRRFYVLRPVGAAELPILMDHPSDERGEKYILDEAPNFEETSTSILSAPPEHIVSEAEIFTREDAERLVTEEHAIQVETDRQTTRALMANPARRAWQVERNDVLIVARELSEAPKSPLPEPIYPIVDFSAEAETAQEQRVEMVFARIHPNGISKVTGRDAHGEPAAWTTKRDFRLLNGVRDFTHNEIHWTVFLLPTPVSDDEAVPLLTSGPPPEGVFAALANYYDTHLEQLEAEQIRNDLIREAREAFQEKHVPSRPVRVLNFWKVEGAQ